MALKKTIKTTGGLSLLVWLVIGQVLFLGKGVQAGNNGQLSGFNTTQPYLIYYGNWTASQVGYARTNYHPSGLSIGSEMMVESGTGYDERNGSFYVGTISGLGWTLGPSGTGTNFEVRISRQAQYAGGAPLFTNSTIRVVFQDNRGSVLIPQGISYTFADGGPYENWRAQYFTAAELDNPAISGDGADLDGGGIPNVVEFAFNLNPRVALHINLPSAFVQNISGHDYLEIQYTQRNAPAGVQYLLQTSPDLLSWNTTSFIQVNATDNGDGTSLITLRLQTPITDAPGQFVRIAIQR